MELDAVGEHKLVMNVMKDHEAEPVENIGDDEDATPEDIHEAKMEELRFIDKEGVWKPALVSDAKAATGKGPMPTRWVINVKRGDAGERIVRARLVPKDFRPKLGVKGRSMSDIVATFASMPLWR